MTKYLHTMIRVSDPAATIDFFKLVGLEEVRRFDSEAGRFTLIFLAPPGQEDIAEVELTYNWPPEDGSAPEEYTGGRNFGHLAYRVDNIYETCQRLMDGGGDDQPPAARWPYGVRALTRRHFGRAAAGRPSAAAGTLGVDAEYRRLVSGSCRDC
jgi:lactoylglutathione lyase